MNLHRDMLIELMKFFVTARVALKDFAQTMLNQSMNLSVLDSIDIDNWTEISLEPTKKSIEWQNVKGSGCDVVLFKRTIGDRTVTMVLVNSQIGARKYSLSYSSLGGRCSLSQTLDLARTSGDAIDLS